MPNQPLQPFAPSPLFLSYFPSGISAGVVIMWLLYAAFAFWAIYTIVAVYHWLKYSHASWVAFPAIAIHLAVSLALIGYTLSGHGMFLALP